MRNSSLVQQMKDLPVKILLAEGILLQQGRRVVEMVPQELLCAHTVHPHFYFLVPIQVAARAKAWDRSLSLAGTVGSNSAGGLDVYLL
jgi:hypothetical protein